MSSESASPYWIVAKCLNILLTDMAGPRPLRLAQLEPSGSALSRNNLILRPHVSDGE